MGIRFERFEGHFEQLLILIRCGKIFLDYRGTVNITSCGDGSDLLITSLNILKEFI